MYITGYLDPQWDLSAIKQLNYKLDYHKDTNLIDQYVSSGHNHGSIHLYNCFEDNLVVDLSYIRSNFNWVNNLALAINLFTPGQYLPMHKDLYQKYSRAFNISSTNSIIRIILMLEDNCPGQVLQIEKRAIADWKAGEWFGWSGNDAHAFYNLSMSDRYAVQITGTI